MIHLANIRKLSQLIFIKDTSAFLIKSFSLLLMLVFIASCDAPVGSPTCVEADEWGDIEEVEVTVNAEDRLTYSGIETREGNDIDISVNGLIDLCSTDKEYRSYGYTKGNVYMNPISASTTQWQAASYASNEQGDNTEYVYVEEGQPLTIAISGEYYDRNGQVTDGKGLYAYIQDQIDADGKPVLPPASSNAYDEDAWWFGKSGDNLGEENRLAVGGEIPEFFELYNNGTTSGAGFYGVAPKSGYLLFRYARNSSANRVQRYGPGTLSNPWLGEYAWEEHKCESCMQTTIFGSCVVTVFAYPVCVATWLASCAGEGHLEEAYGDKDNALVVTSSGRKCREHYKWQDLDWLELNPNSTAAEEGDHWIDNAYDGSQSDAYVGQANSGGYEIAISSGCPGTYGQYLEMHIGEPTVTLTPKTTPEGCDPATESPCDYVLDSWGETKILEPAYAMDNPDVTDLDLRTSGYGSGKYEGQSGASGEIWLHIKDTKTSINNTQLDEDGYGYYGDNAGSYSVTIKTEKVNTDFSDFLQNIVNPVRGVIFGYCKIIYEPAEGESNYDEEEATRIEDLQYTISEEDCDSLYSYTDDNGNEVTAWKSGITKRMYQQLVGGYNECMTDDSGKCLTDANGYIIYDSTTGNSFLDALRAALVLYVVIYAGMFMMGMVETKQDDFLKRVLKFAIVAILLSPDSWDFFNNYLFSLFTQGMDDLITILTSDLSVPIVDLSTDPLAAAEDNPPQDNNIFAFADMTVDRFFQEATWIKIAGLLFATPVGFIYIVLILLGFAIFIASVMKALILYLLATLAISLLLIVAPIYISFMLFDRTKPLFDAWIKSLISYTLQPAMVFTALAIFNVFVFSSLYSLLYYKVCWQEIWTSYWKLKDGTTIEIGSFLNFYHPVVPLTLGDGTERVSGLSLQDMSTPTQFFLIMIFLIICASLIRFIDWMADAASELVTGNKAGSLSAVSNSTMNKGVAIMSQIASETLSKVAGPAVKKMAEAVQKQRQKDKQKRQAGQSEKK